MAIDQSASPSNPPAAPTLISVSAFGPWTVTVDDEPAPAIRSRYARELLLAFALDSGPVARVVLIDQLRPDEADTRTARRRLTRELSRLQADLGVPLWDSTADLVSVADTVRVESDVGDTLSHIAAGPRSGDRNRETWELRQLLRRLDAGPLLPGHDSEWAMRLRARFEGHAAELRHRLLGLLTPIDAAEALDHARRLVELNPFDDRAHAAVVRSLRAERNADAAQAYANEVEAIYKRELNASSAPPAVQLALTEPRSQPPPLHLEIAELREAFTANSHRGQRSDIARRLDDALRAAGNQAARLDLVEDLALWRQAEVLLFRGELEGAEARLAQADGDDAGEQAGWARLTWGLLRYMHGRNDEAEQTLRELLGEDLPPRLEIEANLRLERVLDALGDVSGSRRCCFAALDLARDIDDPAARAAALAALGWSLSRSYRLAEATTHLEQALELAETIGADTVRVSALGGLGNLAYWGRRHGTAASHMQACVAIAKRNGDLAALLRWLVNEAIPQSTIGNFDRLTEVLTELQELPAGLLTPPAQARVLEIEARLAVHHGELHRALAIRATLGEHYAATGEAVPLLTNRNGIVEILLAQGESAQALETARVNQEAGIDLDIGTTWQQILAMRHGAALVASGETEAGVEMLAGAIGHGEPEQILSASCHVTYHDALIELGRHDEARLVRHSVRHMLDAFGHDLTPEQWKMAKRHSPYVQPLLPLVDHG